MKYTNIYSRHQHLENDYFKMEAVCRECGNKLVGGEFFCPKCGHKLELLPWKIDVADVVKLLTKEYQGKSQTPKEGTSPSDISEEEYKGPIIRAEGAERELSATPKCLENEGLTPDKKCDYEAMSCDELAWGCLEKPMDLDEVANWLQAFAMSGDCGWQVGDAFGSSSNAVSTWVSLLADKLKDIATKRISESTAHTTQQELLL